MQNALVCFASSNLTTTNASPTYKSPQYLKELATRLKSAQVKEALPPGNAPQGLGFAATSGELFKNPRPFH